MLSASLDRVAKPRGLHSKSQSRLGLDLKYRSSRDFPRRGLETRRFLQSTWSRLQPKVPGRSRLEGEGQPDRVRAHLEARKYLRKSCRIERESGQRSPKQLQTSLTVPLRRESDPNH